MASNSSLWAQSVCNNLPPAAAALLMINELFLYIRRREDEPRPPLHRGQVESGRNCLDNWRVLRHPQDRLQGHSCQVTDMGHCWYVPRPPSQSDCCCGAFPIGYSPLWGVSPHDLDGLLVLGSPRPARHSRTPSDAYPLWESSSFPVGHSIECAKQIGRRTLHSPKSIAEHATSTRLRPFPIVSLQATIDI